MSRLKPDELADREYLGRLVFPSAKARRDHVFALAHAGIARDLARSAISTACVDADVAPADLLRLVAEYQRSWDRHRELLIALDEADQAAAALAAPGEVAA